METEQQGYLVVLWEYFRDPTMMIIILVSLGYVFRDWISNFLSKNLDYNINTKLEKIRSEFRDREIRLEAELRRQERGLERNLEFIGSLRRERSSILQTKRIEAIETVMKRCQVLSKQTVTVEMMKIIKGEYLSKISASTTEQQKMSGMCETLGVDSTLKDLQSTDVTIARLYLPDEALRLFNAYEGIVFHAIMVLKSASLGVDTGIIKDDALRGIVEPVWPTSKEGFDKYGDGFGYYWLQSAYNQLVKVLRLIASGEHQGAEDAETAIGIAVESQKATISAQASMEAASIPTAEAKLIEEQSKLVRAGQKKTSA